MYMIFPLQNKIWKFKIKLVYLQPKVRLVVLSEN